jgi:hypothetical protein
MLESFGRFDGPGDPHLEQTVFKLVHGHRLEQRLTYGHGPYRAGDAVLRLGRSAGVLARIPAELLEVLFLIDGKQAMGSILDGVVEAREEAPVSLRSGALVVVLRLFELGILEVA